MKKQIKLIAIYLSLSLLMAGCNEVAENTQEDKPTDTSITEQETQSISSSEETEETITEETVHEKENSLVVPEENPYQEYYTFIQNIYDYHYHLLNIM